MDPRKPDTYNSINSVVKFQLNRSVLDWFVEMSMQNGRQMEDEEFEVLSIENFTKFASEKGKVFYLFKDKDAFGP